MNEEYFTEHPWSGDNGSHEDWEKVLTLKALALGGNIMYLWVRGEGPEITAANLVNRQPGHPPTRISSQIPSLL